MSRAPFGPIPLGFSSMGAPDLTLEETLALADAFGLDFVELRALQGRLDLPILLEGTASPPPARAHILVVASSLRLCDEEKDDIAEFGRHAMLAARLGAPYVRLFGGGIWGRKLAVEDLRRAASRVAACRKYLSRHAPSVRILLETHYAFSSSSACRRLNHELDEPLDILWDSHHTWRMAMERPEETWREIGPLVRHIHYKDSIHRLDHESRSHYVLPGEGDYPTDSLLEILRQGGYHGGLSLEWEKLWHSTLPPLRQALPSFQALFRQGFPPKM